MKQIGSFRWLILAFLSLLAILWWIAPADSIWKQPSTWQRMTQPGRLSAAHAHLEDNCSACHIPVRGVEPERCIACHANNEFLLKRQPTSFHATISRCTDCHFEHQGRSHRPSSMDHEVLAITGLRELAKEEGDTEKYAAWKRVSTWLDHGATPHLRISPLDATLQCASCHANDDRHFDLFGKDCAQCHATGRWTVPEFRHPSPTSNDCAHCHQAPPSHYMMHFKMISARVAGKPNARVEQCFECHQTTAWPDIRDAGWYKHH